MLSDGNLLSRYTSGAWKSALGSIEVVGDKWYWENQLIDAGIGHMYGIALPTAVADSHNTDIFGVYAYDGTTFASGAQSQSYASAFSPGDVVGVALDLTPGGTSGTLTFYKNGVSLGAAFSALDCSKTYFPWVLENGNASNGGSFANFGQKPFKFPPPAGFQPLNAANVRPSTIVARPDQYVDVRSGLTAQFTISDLDFETNLVIAKSSSHDEYWIWADSVRGFIGGLRSNDTNAEGSGLAIANVNSNGYQSDSNWFSNGRTYVTYSFKAGGNSNTFNIDDVGYATASAAGLTAGTITPTGASVNTKSGFSIINGPWDK
jgi:hypothetical protein